MTIFIIGWVLLFAYLISQRTRLQNIAINVQFIWVETALLSITGGALWLLYAV